LTERSRYLAYLLRLWQVGSGQETTWRASLEDAHTGERQAFGGLDDLFRFLCQQTGVWSGVKGSQDIHYAGGEPMGRSAERC
jgi:hypothetical protein